MFWFCCIEHQLAYWHIRFTSVDLYYYIRAHPKQRTVELVKCTRFAKRAIKCLSKGNELQKLVKQIGQNSDQWITEDSYGDGISRDDRVQSKSLGRKSTADTRRRR